MRKNKLNLNNFIRLNEGDFKLAAGLTPRERQRLINGESLIPDVAPEERPTFDILDPNDVDTWTIGMPREVKVEDDYEDGVLIDIPDPSEDDILNDWEEEEKRKEENNWDMNHIPFDTLAQEKDFDNWVLSTMNIKGKGLLGRPNRWVKEAKEIMSWYKELHKIK